MEGHQYGIENSEERIYQNALILESGGLYQDAANEFARIPDYRDAAQRQILNEERSEAAQKDKIYADGDKAAANPNVKSQQKAIEYFRRIPGWRDADRRIIEAEERIEQIIIKEREDRKEAIRKAAEARIRRRKRMIGIAIAAVIVAMLATVLIVGKQHYQKYRVPELRYAEAEALMAAGDTDAAYRVYRNLSFGENTQRNLFRIAKDRLGTVEVGSTVLFGAYEQDNNRENGPEYIEWLVLDQSGSTRLLISKYALDSILYQDGFAENGCTWNTSTIRAWLNGPFLSSAFSAGEQQLILRTTVPADPNPFYPVDNGMSTLDKVYLLSIPEVCQYFPTNRDRLCVPTRYAIVHSAYMSSSGNHCWWWLRTLGDDRDFYRATGVGTSGEIIEMGHYIYSNGYSVRPVIRIDLDAEWSDRIRPAL